MNCSVLPSEGKYVEFVNIDYKASSEKIPAGLPGKFVIT
jgi:hypothetical protein